MKYRALFKLHKPKATIRLSQVSSKAKIEQTKFVLKIPKAIEELKGSYFADGLSRNLKGGYPL